jgi:hypothetical protein
MILPMLKNGLIWLFIGLGVTANAQHISEFSADTALFHSELVAFTGSSLETTEVPDFERFLQLYDSLPYERRMEIIDVSNRMLAKNCRPRPHFIKFQRIMLEFFNENKTGHGYEEWLDGFRHQLAEEEVLLRTLDQWLSLSLSLLDNNILFSSSGVTWSISPPEFQFRFQGTMTVQLEGVTMDCHAGRDSIRIEEVSNCWI